MDAKLSIARARSLLGVRFRPQGRDPLRGLDCIGLARIAYAVPAGQGRDDYHLSGEGLGSELRNALTKDFRRIWRPSRRPGDLLVLRPGRRQWHVAILTDRGFIHADTRRRMVIETPGNLEWPLAAVYRRRSRKSRRIG
jgi:cell wall-associated NlpC family hydrolase